MPAPLSILIALGLIAGLAIVLRVTYGSDRTVRRYRIADEPELEGYPVVLVADEPDGRHDELDPEPAETLLATAAPGDDRYGLLRSVVITADPVQATAIQAILRDAGIRATLATDRTGIRVLVFPEALDQARRLVR